MHSLLRRQLKKCFGEPYAVPQEWRAFLDLVDSAYRESDVDRRMLERSLDLSSQELLDSKARLHAVFNQVDTWILIIDADTLSIIEANRKAADMTGYPRERIIGKVCHSLICPAERGRCPVRDLGQEFDRSERALLRADGTSIDILKTVNPITIEGRECFLESFVDISARKRAEEALRASEVGIGVVHGRVFREANPRVCQMTGYSREELIGQSARILYPTEEEFEFVGAEKYRQIAESGLGTVETRWVTKDGHIIDVLLSSTPTDPENEALGVTFTALDITQTKQATEALRRSENLLRRALEVLPVGLWIADAAGNLLSGNEAARRIWGAQHLARRDEYGAFKARRLPSGEVVGPDDWAIVRTLTEGATVVDELLEIETFDGRKRIVYNSTAPVLDDSGNVEAAIIINQDIT